MKNEKKRKGQNAERLTSGLLSVGVSVRGQLSVNLETHQF